MRGLTITMTVTLGLCATSRTVSASSITQTINFGFASHGSNYTPYSQFDPALGPLHEVDIAISGTLSSDDYTFSNRTFAPITFAGTIEASVSAAMTGVVLRSTFTDTLGPFPATLQGQYVSGPYNVTNSFSATTQSLAYWIGTRTLAPDVLPSPSGAWSSDSGIAVTASGLGGTISGTETITYVYGVVTPEPASFVMLRLGLAAVAGFAWRRRAA